MKIIGITGGTGAGKTTALRVLGELGAEVIDCDALYYRLLHEDNAMLQEIAARFPGMVQDGVLLRKKLGELVFTDPAAMAALNAIAHRYVMAAMDGILARAAAAGKKLAAVDAIAILESGYGKKCDIVFGVIAPEEMRVRRIMGRDGIEEAYALKRIRAQKDEDFYRTHCDRILINDYPAEAEFAAYCRKIFTELEEQKTMESELFYTKKNAWEQADAASIAACEAYCDAYKAFLDAGKTERLAVKRAIAEAEAHGFRPYVPGQVLRPGDKVYKNNRGKALLLAVIGQKRLSQGAHIAAAHVDSPRLDLKQVPMYEDGDMALFKTHYYGGIKKYQWVTVPLELHGVVVLRSGKTVELSIGGQPGEPQFVVTDLLPHLGQEQMKKVMSEAFTGENLNILIGSRPDTDAEKDRVKSTVLKLLHEKYGVEEEDFISAELEAVPAYKAVDIGFDRSLIGAYGHDDRVCAYAELKAIFELDKPAYTAVCILADKEEIGSEGVTGMKSRAFECFMADLCAAQNVRLEHCFANSLCVSADVCNAFDPNFPEVSEVRNSAKINCGVALVKFTGSRGKSGSNDASAETVGRLRKLFNDGNVVWQMAELGKVDMGGGGTVAMYMSQRDIETIDAGVPVLSMHAPFEVVAKMDVYMTFLGVKAVYEEK